MLPCPKIPHTPAKKAVSRPSRSTYCCARKFVSAWAIVNRRVFKRASIGSSYLVRVPRSSHYEQSHRPPRLRQADRHLQDKARCGRRERRERLGLQTSLL